MLSLLPTLALSGTVGYAQSTPQPPCGSEPVPAYPALDATAAVQSWSRLEMGHDWKPPGCSGWTETGFSTLVTIAARFRYAGNAGDLLRHIGAISTLAGVFYWSTTHQRWQPLITDAYALTAAESGRRRKDFGPDEMKAGSTIYFEQTDNLTGKAVYRMHIAEASADRIVLEIENVSTMRYFFLPVFHAGEVQAIYCLDRESDGVWRYYSMARTGKDASFLVTANEASPINRAVAFYRHFVGIPTGQEPPAAR